LRISNKYINKIFNNYFKIRQQEFEIKELKEKIEYKKILIYNYLRRRESDKIDLC